MLLKCRYEEQAFGPSVPFSLKEGKRFFFFLVFCCCCFIFLMVTLVAYGGFWARDRVQAAAVAYATAVAVPDP